MSGTSCDALCQAVQNSVPCVAYCTWISIKFSWNIEKYFCINIDYYICRVCQYVKNFAGASKPHEIYPPPQISYLPLGKQRKRPNMGIIAYKLDTSIQSSLFIWAESTAHWWFTHQCIPTHKKIANSLSLLLLWSSSIFLLCREASKASASAIWCLLNERIQLNCKITYDN